MSGDFSKYSNFNEKNNFSSVRFGANSPVLEVELNEAQQIQWQRIKSFVKSYVGDGIITEGSDLIVEYFPDPEGGVNGELHIYSTAPFQACQNGIIIDVYNRYRDEGENQSLAPYFENTLSNIQEGDSVYIRIYEQEVGYNDTIKDGGYVDSQLEISNNILDSRIKMETSRRQQIVYEFTTSKDSYCVLLGTVKDGAFVMTENILLKPAETIQKLLDMEKTTQSYNNRVKSLEGKTTNLSGDGTTFKGTSSKADKLTNARTISVNGDVEGSFSFDGSGNVTTKLDFSDEKEGEINTKINEVSTSSKKYTDTKISEVNTSSKEYTNTKVNNIKIGGRNLATKNSIGKFQDSDVTLNADGTYTILAKASYTSAGLKISDTLFKQGKNYVISFGISVDDGTLNNIGGHSESFVTNKTILDNVTTTRSWGADSNTVNWASGTSHHISIFVTRTTDSSDNNFYIQPNRNRNTSGADCSVTISNIKVEEGNIETAWSPAYEDYLPFSGGTLTGDVKLPNTRSSMDGSLIYGGSVKLNDTTQFNDLQNFKTTIGSCNFNDDKWYNIINVRHKNGYNDGNLYGFYIKTNTTVDENLTWNNQIKGTWNTERTILDNENKDSFVNKCIYTSIPTNTTYDSNYIELDTGNVIKFKKTCTILIRVVHQVTDYTLMTIYTANESYYYLNSAKGTDSDLQGYVSNMGKTYYNTSTLVLSPNANNTLRLEFIKPTTSGYATINIAGTKSLLGKDYTLQIFKILG